MPFLPYSWSGIAAPSLNNADYQADLDSLSISTRMEQNETSYIEESKAYYDGLSNGNINRGTEFLINLGISEYGDQGDENWENGLKKFDEVYNNIDSTNQNEYVYGRFRFSLLRGLNFYSG